MTIPIPNPEKRLMCEFDRPSNISQRVTYDRTFLNGMLADPLFVAIEDLLEDAKTQVDKLDAAEIKAAGKLPGAAAARDTELLKTNIIMDKVLAKVQEAGDDDIPNSKTLFESHQLKIRARSKTEKGEFEATQGKLSKTIDVQHQFVKGTVAYLFLISTDKENWFFGAFGTTSNNTIVKINDEDLVVTTKYYLKSCTCKKRVYSNWSQIIEVVCI